MPVSWGLSLVTLAAAAFLFPAPSLAADAPSVPVLRVETGTHSGAIPGIATSANGRYFVTASIDKTARIWDTASGNLLQVLRPPIGSGEDGKLYAVAVSSDGKTIAVGGWTQLPGERAHSIYLFQREGGRLVKRIGGLPSAVFRLVFSTDGRYLGATTFEGAISLYRVNDFSRVGADHQCRDRAYGLDMSDHGQLASACVDGFVRLYQFDDAGLRLVRTRRLAPDGYRPFSLKFSPDGSRLALGYTSSAPTLAPVIAVFDAKTLESLLTPDTSGADAGFLSVVGWSADGNSLYAAGGFSVSGKRNAIRRWSAGGKGPHVDLEASEQTVTSLTALPQGGILYGSLDGALGQYDSRNHLASLTTPKTLDGLQVAKITELSEDIRTLLAAGLRSGFASNDSATGLSVTDIPGEDPKINGRRLGLESAEFAYAYSIAPDSQTVVLATQRYLRAFSREGRALWAVPIPAQVPPIGGVGVSRDGNFASTFYYDGTWRWYRLRDGKELLAIFVADGKRWIAWTPNGYYHASLGAEELVGWHLNRGRDETADFYPVSRFRGQFYRPDVVAEVLQAGDEAGALRIANAAAKRKAQATRVEQVLPPVVDIVSPASDATAVTSPVSVKFAVRAPTDAPVTTIRVRVNGQPVSLADPGNLVMGISEGTREVAIPIPPQDSDVMIFAENKNGVSTPGLLRIIWRGATPTREEEFSAKPKLYVLAVGVSEYELRDLRLGFAAKDAKDFVTVLLGQKGRLYRDVEAKLLTDAAATRDEVVDGLDWIRRQVTSRDVGMVFLAGHGVNDSDGTFYYLPVNADPEKLKRTGVVASEIKNTLAALAGKAIFFVDTCHSGNVLGTGRRSANSDVTAVVNELASAENGVLVFSAATGRQYSMEDSRWENGAFTKAVVEGLTGKADLNRSGRVTHRGLDFYVAERVKELTGGMQTPVTIVPQGVPNFPLAVVN